ncbi:MAG: hypothetical protein DDT23_00369 [candidate division WS2 bacterium]|nr:hypothetical protein [Candidatus Lithacetigena glycinireducens]
MRKYYSLEKVRSIRNEISKLGERKSNRLKVNLSKAGARYDKAKAEWSKGIAEWDVQLFTLLVQICPESHYRNWTGYLIIPKSKDEDWIVPVWTGNYFGVKHKAFSIWEIPKYSCNGSDAKEVKDA